MREHPRAADDHRQAGLASAAAITRLLQSASAVAYSTAGESESLRWAVDHVADLMGWPVGHVFAVDAATGTLTTSGIWHLADRERYDGLVDATVPLHLDPTQLPGAGVGLHAPMWMPTAEIEPSVPRAAAIAACDLGGYLRFPIVGNGGIEGVVELFGPDPVAPDSALLDLCAYVGLMAGHLLDLVRSREALERSESFLAEAQRLAHLGSWSWNVADDTVVWSDELYRIYGLDRTTDVVGHDVFFNRVHPDDRDRVATTVRDALARADWYEHEYRVVLADGEVRWVSSLGTMAERRDGSVAVVGYCQDITARKAAEAHNRALESDLTNQERILERIARGEPLGSIFESLCLAFESRYPGCRCSILRLDPTSGLLHHAAAPSLPESFRSAIDGLPVGEGMAACGTAAARNELVVVEDTRTDPLTAAYQPVADAYGLRSVWSVPLNDQEGTVTGTFAVYGTEPRRPGDAEVKSLRAAGSLAAIAIERQRAEDAITEAARVDDLTGLPNRSQFLELLTRRLRDPAARVGVLFCDLDRFKWINDSLGHPAGDRILVEVADRLRAVVAPGDLVARFGGDEFSVLVEGATPESVADAASRIASVFTLPFPLDSGEFFLSVSTGIAMNDHEADASGLVRDADAAMYAAKERGRARYAMFDEELRHRAVARVTLESDLRRAIERHEVELHFQPVRDFEHDTWCGVEALARWQHPTRGLVSPDQFIPLAEETGLIIPLGLQILELAAAEAARLAAAGEVLTVAANISVVQLADPGVAEQVAAVLERFDLPPSALSLEVTESALMAELDAASAVLRKIVELGVDVLIDDFGTGYSSIARLGDLPVCGLKIDRQFTERLGSGPSATRVFAAIADLAHALDLHVVAEGIEDATMLATVREIGCEQGQGYHLARPVPSGRLLDVLHGTAAS